MNSNIIYIKQLLLSLSKHGPQAGYTLDNDTVDKKNEWHLLLNVAYSTSSIASKEVNKNGELFTVAWIVVLCHWCVPPLKMDDRPCCHPLPSHVVACMAPRRRLPPP